MYLITKIPVSAALALVCSSSISLAGELVVPTDSASEFSAFVVAQRYQIYADHCSAKLPELKPRFDDLLDSLTNRIRESSSVLVAHGRFEGMGRKAVPAEIIDAFRDVLHDIQHNFERRDPVRICHRTLQGLVELDDEKLKSELDVILTAVQKMLSNLDSDRARQTSRGA